MKAIKSTLISTSEWVKTHAKIHTVVALLVFAVGLAATFYYWNNLRKSIQTDMDVAYQRQTRAIGQSASNRLVLYENLLRGSAGLVKVDGDINQDDWNEFHQPYEISKKFPDVYSIGVSRYLTKDQVPAFLERRYAQGDTNYLIYPEGDRDVYTPIVFSSVYAENKSAARGYDGYSNAVRRTAMNKAIDTGKPAMSGKLRLVTESRPNRSSFILFMPIYQEGAPTGTVEERRAAIRAFSYISVDFTGLIENSLKPELSPNIALELRDAESDSNENLVYKSAALDSVKEEEYSKVETTEFDLYGHRWRITVAASQDIISDRDRDLPMQALWRGLLTCIFFAGLVWYLITDRERKYARQKQEEVQTAKDDLLSLASHQLRTPATVVKQYVGMMLQGYAGKLTEQQLSMLSNAYDSNERQLEIINQLLYVARLDAGRIILRHEKTDAAKLIRDVAHEQSEALAARGQQLTFKLPKNPVWAELDPHYMRMVVENLLSNAIKYTPENGQITLAARRSHGNVVIRVSDTGVGIDPGVQRNIFEKFTRVENELSNDVNGSGVGLYLTQQIVTLHGGTIEVKSALGQGSSFIVRIPAKASTVKPQEGAV